MYDLSGDIHGKFLADLRTRGSGEIALASPYVRQVMGCVGDECQWDASAKAAENLPTYCGSGFSLEEKSASAAKFGLLLGDVEAPKHTLMVLRHVVTTPREDRDKDVLLTSGAKVDPKMPLLWQHLIGVPIGKMVAVVDHTPEVLRVATALLDLNELTHDAAKLIEADALRFSHGFRVLEYRERKASTGFEVTSFEILEVSLVSVPSNVDAVIEMYAKGGLSSEPMKRFAKGLDEVRVKSLSGIALKEQDETAAVEEPEPKAKAEPPCTCAAKVEKAIEQPAEVVVEAAHPVEDKAGRVLSKRNLTKLTDVREYLQEMHDHDKLPKPCKAMCRECMKAIDEVIAEASKPMDDEEETPAKTVEQSVGELLVEADASALKRYRGTINALLEADELNQLAEQFGV